MASLAFQLADSQLDGQLIEIINGQRQQGQSWDRIARDLSARTGAYIPAETVRRWCRELDVEALLDPQDVEGSGSHRPDPSATPAHAEARAS